MTIEGNSESDFHDDFVKTIMQNHHITFEQARVIERLLESGAKVTFSYGHPAREDGVRVCGAGVETMGAAGFEFRDGVWRLKKWLS